MLFLKQELIPKQLVYHNRNADNTAHAHIVYLADSVAGYQHPCKDCMVRNNFQEHQCQPSTGYTASNGVS